MPALVSPLGIQGRHQTRSTMGFTFLITILYHKQPAEPYRSPAVRVRATPLLPSLSLLRTFLVRFFRIIRRLSRLCARLSFYRLAVVGVVQASGLPNIGRPLFW